MEPAEVDKTMVVLANIGDGRSFPSSKLGDSGGRVHKEQRQLRVKLAEGSKGSSLMNIGGVRNPVCRTIFKPDFELNKSAGFRVTFIGKDGRHKVLVIVHQSDLFGFGKRTMKNLQARDVKGFFRAKGNMFAANIVLVLGDDLIWTSEAGGELGRARLGPIDFGKN